MTLPGPTTSTSSFHTVNFRQVYSTPPAVFALATNEGGDPCALRLRNVTTTGFQIIQAEPSDKDGGHAQFSDVGYFAIEPGTAEIAPGVFIEAGTHTTSTTVQSTNAFPSAGGHDTVNLATSFGSPPAILADIQTTNSSDPIGAPAGKMIPWFTTSVRNITGSSFRVALDRAEVNDGGTVLAETIGYVAFSATTGHLLDRSGRTVALDAFISADNIDGWTNQNPDGSGRAVPFTQAFAAPPVAIASMAKRDGGDGGWLRRGALTNTDLYLTVDEDTYNDGDRGHTTEAASVVAFSQPLSGLTGDLREPFIRYTFESSSGGDVPDVAANGPTYDGTLGGGAFVTTGGLGIAGEALECDGTNDYVSPNDVDELDADGHFTVSLWFRRRSDGASATNHNTNNVLIAQSSNADNDNLEIGTDGAAIELYVDTQDRDASATYGAGVANDTWYHLVFTYDRYATDGNEVKLYLDGGLVTAQSSWGGLLDNSGSSELTFGVARLDRGDPWGDFDGWLDEVQIYRRALTAPEIHFLTTHPARTAAAYPEPGTGTLTLLGLLGLLRRRRRRAR